MSGSLLVAGWPHQPGSRSRVRYGRPVPAQSSWTSPDRERGDQLIWQG
jgi:hypothetical protein